MKGILGARKYLLAKLLQNMAKGVIVIFGDNSSGVYTLTGPTLQSYPLFPPGQLPTKCFKG